MERQRWNRDMMEQMMSLLQFFQDNGISVDRSLGTGILALLPEDPKLRMAYAMMRFMDEIPGGFMIYRAHGAEEIIYANRGLLRILRCDSWEQFQKLTGGSFRGLVHPEDLDEVEESIKRQIADSQYDLDYVEYRVICRDGTISWIEDYGHFAHGESMGDFFYVFLGDATEKKDRQRGEREEAERRYQGLIQEYDRERALINQEHLRRLEVIEGLSVNYETILYADLEQDRILPYRLSQRTVRQFGEKYQMKGLRWYLDDYVKVWVHPEDREMVIRETDPEYIRKRLLEITTYYMNYRVICGDEVQYLQLRVVNVSAGERVDQIVMGYRRVDEELQRELQQKQMLAEALENANLAIVAKNEFLSNMSHDMRTPLNAIFGYTTLAKMEITEPEALGYLERVESAGRQLLDLIDKVLEMSWIGSKEREQEEECNLCQIAREVWESFLAQATEKDLRFTLDCSDVRHSAILSDRERLRQLITYLASNAVIYTEPGGQASITLEEREDRDRPWGTYCIVVEDTGVGMDQAFLKRVFEPFARQRNSTFSGVPGVGLGLTIAKYIVDRMGGTIQVDSVAGKGSVFTVTLHLQVSTRGAAARQPEGLEQAAGQKILLVEDNEINREVETEILRGGGFSVDTAENGREAVDKVKGSAPGTYDLVLMDIQMPVMDGWQAARAIRSLEDPELAGIPIMALSANVLESDVRQSLESGMDAHLAKPLDVSQLLRELHRWTEKKNEKKNS